MGRNFEEDIEENEVSLLLSNEFLLELVRSFSSSSSSLLSSLLS